MSSPPEALDSNDLWLLESVAELSTPLRMLLGPEVALALNMKRSHGLSREALCEKLTSLSDRGLIWIHHASDESMVARTQAEVDHVLVMGRPSSSPYSFYYGLTPRGGAAWEHHARPDWSRYLDATVSYQPDVCVIEALSEEAAEAEYQRHARSPDEHQPLAESKQGEVLTSWQATYWKTLPTGYRLRYAWVRRRPDIPRSQSEKPPPPWYSSLVLDR